MAFTSFLPEPFGIVVPAVAWGILSGVSWYVGRGLATLGWLLFSIAGGLLIIEGVAGDTPALTVFFALLIGGLGFVFADLYYRERYKAGAAT